MKRKLKGHWNSFENCKEEAQKYNTKTEFRDGCIGAYLSSIKHKWLDKVCVHMTLLRKPKGYYNRTMCRKLALECNTTKEFKNKHYSAYKATNIKNWFSDVCSHMEIDSEFNLDK